MVYKLVQEEMDGLLAPEQPYKAIPIPDHDADLIATKRMIEELAENIDTANILSETATVFDKPDGTDTTILLTAVEHLASKLGITVLMPSKESFKVGKNAAAANRFVASSLESGIGSFVGSIFSTIWAIIKRIGEAISKFFSWITGSGKTGSARQGDDEAKVKKAEEQTTKKIGSLKERVEKSTKEELKDTIDGMKQRHANYLQEINEFIEVRRSQHHQSGACDVFACGMGHSGFILSIDQLFDKSILKTFKDGSRGASRIGEVTDEYSKVFNNTVSQIVKIRDKSLTDITNDHYNTFTKDELMRLETIDIMAFNGDGDETWHGYGYHCVKREFTKVHGVDYPSYKLDWLSNTIMADAVSKFKIRDENITLDNAEAYTKKMADSLKSSLEELRQFEDWYTQESKGVREAQKALKGIEGVIQNNVVSKLGEVAGAKEKVNALLGLYVKDLGSINAFIQMWMKIFLAMKETRQWIDKVGYYYQNLIELKAYEDAYKKAKA